MAITTYSSFFTNINTSIINTVAQLIPEIFGLASSIKNNVHPRYKVIISASGGHYTKPWIAEGVLQEKIVIKTASRWEEIGLFQMGNNEFASLAANKFGLSLVNSFSSRRRWTGSSPINIIMKLKFEAENTAKEEVTKACAKLQGLSLPNGASFNIFGGGVFLQPPGPNPWGTQDYGENISIDIGGGWLRFENVIVEDVATEFENRMSAEGPIGAVVTINLSTYELVTREGLEKAYNNSSIFGDPTVNKTPPNNNSNTNITGTTIVNNVISNSAATNLTKSIQSINPISSAFNSGVNLGQTAGQNLLNAVRGVAR